MDNAKKIISDSESSSNETERKNKISDYIDEQFFGIKNEDTSAKKKDEENKQLKVNSDYELNFFKKSDNFSLFSGVICSNTKNVEFLVPENHTCLMRTDYLRELSRLISSNEFTITLNTKKNDYICRPNNIYKYSEGLLIVEQADLKANSLILEIEFILNLRYPNRCSINIVFAENDVITTNNYTFKNSIVFTNVNDGDGDGKVPYRYSGNGGYLNGFPLKICDDNNLVYNEYYIIGRDKNGKCRTGDDINNYLYYYDIPFIFNKNYIYSCQKEESNILLTESTLYKKIMNIQKVGKYGSSSYTNLNDKNDWLELDKNKISNVNDRDNTITMKFFIGTKKEGIYSHKYIDSIDISSSEKSQDNHFKLEILYYDLEEDPIYNKEPDIPTFVPRIPSDILDPLLYSEVDK